MNISNTPIRQTVTTARTTESKLTKTAPDQTKNAAKTNNFVSVNKPDASSDVDMAKVNEISALLAEGKLELDLDTLSDAILEMHRR